MKTSVQRAVGFLGIAFMAAQLMGAATEQPRPFRSEGDPFEYAVPVTPAQKDAEKLFRQIAYQAVAVARHGSTLESFARGGQRMMYETHAAELMGAKEAINAMGADFRQLQELRPSILAWQQMMIDRLQPALAGLAGNATEAIEQLNQDRGKFLPPEYRDAVSNLFTYAGQVRELVSVNLDYAEAREKLNRLDAEPLAPEAKMPSAWEGASVSPKAAKSLDAQIRSELLKLPYYGVFDYLAFQVDGDRVILSGEVSRPTLKSTAERVLSRIEGVSVVTNNIKVLPVSFNDNRIRMASYWAIYGHSTLARYRLNPHPPIRIIVENGNVTLKGFVGSDMDRTIANVQVNTVPGAFTVTNHLQVGS